MGLLTEPAENNESFLREEEGMLSRMVRSVGLRSFLGPIHKPQIYMYTYSVRASEGATVQLYCRVKDTLPSDIIWTLTPAKTARGSRINITPGSEQHGFKVRFLESVGSVLRCIVIL